MAASTDPVRAVEALVRSRVRVRLLDAIRRNDRVEKRSLREQVDADRTTVQRNLDSLEEQGWIDRERESYRLTPCGEQIATELFGLLRTVRSGLRLQPALRWLSPAAVDLDLRDFTDADLVLAERSDPYAPVNRHVELIERAREFRGLLPAIGLQPLSTACDYVVEHDREHEMVVTADVAETIRSTPRYVRLVERMAETGNCEVFEYDGDIPYYLGLSGDVVQIGVEDDDGKPQALVESDDGDAREWARRTYAEYRDAAGTTEWSGR